MKAEQYLKKEKVPISNDGKSSSTWEKKTTQRIFWKHIWFLGKAKQTKQNS